MISWLRNLFGCKPKELGKEWEEVGHITGYFAVPHAAVVKLSKGEIKIGDEIYIKGHTTDMAVQIKSMQIDHKPIEFAKVGQEFGVQVKSKVRKTDKVYKKTA